MQNSVQMNSDADSLVAVSSLIVWSTCLWTWWPFLPNEFLQCRIQIGTSMILYIDRYQIYIRILSFKQSSVPCAWKPVPFFVAMIMTLLTTFVMPKHWCPASPKMQLIARYIWNWKSPSTHDEERYALLLLSKRMDIPNLELWRNKNSQLSLEPVKTFPPWFRSLSLIFFARFFSFSGIMTSRKLYEKNHWMSVILHAWFGKFSATFTDKSVYTCSLWFTRAWFNWHLYAFSMASRLNMGVTLNFTFKPRFEDRPWFDFHSESLPRKSYIEWYGHGKSEYWYNKCSPWPNISDTGTNNTFSDYDK